MSYNQSTGGNTGIPPSVQEIGAKIAGNQGGVHYEPKPGSSTSGGVNPERSIFSGSQEPGYEHISAPTLGGQGGYIEPSGGPTYNPSSLGQQNIGSGSTSAYGQSSTGGLPSGVGGTGGATIGGGGINKETIGSGTGLGSGTSTGFDSGVSSGTGTGSKIGTGSGTTGSGTGAPGGSSVYDQTVGNVQRTAEPYVAQAREAAAPYIQQAQPYVHKAQEVGNAALESARPMLNQAAGAATQAYNAAATELDARGINRDSTQQKLAEVGQTMKDYGAVGQQRAGEYFQQAVDQAKTIGQDRENKSIVATIFGTVFLVWLAFGFSIGAVFALGVAGSIAALLSRYSRGHGASTTSNYTAPTGQQRTAPSSGTAGTLGNSGVETHFPRPAHPDNSLNSGLGNPKIS